MTAPEERKRPAGAGAGEPEAGADRPEAGAAEMPGPAKAPPEQPRDAATRQGQEIDWQARAAQSYDQFLRARADYENLLRRTQREVALLVRLGKCDLLLKLLGLADDLERAVGAWRSALKGIEGVDSEALTGGVEMIGRRLGAVLSAEGVEPVEALGQPFDPAFHEAVAAWESPDVDRETVTDEIRRGYTYQGELLRAAQVRVARPPA